MEATIITKNEILKQIGIEEELYGKNCNVVAFDEYATTYGRSSLIEVIVYKGEFKYSNAYIIPTSWLEIKTQQS